MYNFTVTSFDRKGVHVYPFFSVRAALKTFTLLSQFGHITRVVLDRAVREVK